MNTVSIGTVKSLSKALSYCQELDTDEKTILLNLTDAKFIDSNFTALFGAFIFYLESRGAKVKLTKPENGRVYTTLCKNNFLPFFDKEFSRMNDKTQSVIEFQQFDIVDIPKQQEFYKLLKDGLLKNRGLVNLSDKVLKEVTKSIIELFSNATSHSESACGIFCAGQFFPDNKKLDITIVDIGVGIPHKVTSFLNEDIAQNKAIEWAMKRLNSTRGDIGGLGLHLLKELITLTNGKLEIISNTGYYYIKDGKESSEILEYNFPGTIVNIEFKIDDKFYILKGEDE